MRKILLSLVGIVSLVQVVFATTCPSAVPIPGAPTMPYTQTLVCGTTNDITSSNVSQICGSGNYYGGNESVYSWTPTSNYSGVTIAYSGVSWTGIMLYQGCPTSGGTCIGQVQSSTTSKTLTVSGNLTAGVTYYIVFDTWPTPNDPCGGSATFTLNGTVIPPCTAPPTAGTTVASVNPVCPSGTTVLSLSGSTTGTGQTYQWEKSTDGVTFTPIAGATGATYTASQTVPTYYHAVVTCSGLSSTSSDVFVTMNPFMNCYCSSNATSTADDDIGQITLGSFANPATAPTPLVSNSSSVNTYTNYTALPAIDLVYSTTYPFTLTQINQTANYYQCDFGVYIDWNHNGSFSDPGEAVTGVGPATAPANGPHWTTNITVPTSALPGVTRMRVVANETGLTNPCGTYTWGETEDYLVNVLCPTLSEPTALDAGVCSGNSVTLTASTSTPNATISWWDAPTGGTQVGTGNSYTTPTLTSNVSYYPQVDFPTCPSGPRDTVDVVVSAVDVTLVPVNATCNGLNDGTFTQTATACGTGPFTYSVDGGAFGAIPTDLVAGTYSVVVQDANADQSIAYQVVITEPGAPTALTVTNPTFFTATVDWTPQGSETEWVIEYGPTGFTLGTGTQITTTSHPYTITGLDENTVYQFYVRANCVATSAFGGPQTITTDPPFVAWDNTCGPGFMDISGTGTFVSTTDDSESGLTLPWSWNIFGTTVNTITIGNNGGVLFNTLTGNVGYTATGNGMFPYVQDLGTPATGDGVFYQSMGTAPNRQFVIMWKNVPHYGGFPAYTDGASFEIVVDEATSEVYYLYNDVLMSDPFYDYGADAEIRLITASGTTTVSNNNATYLQNNSCVHFYGALCPNITSVTSTLYADQADLDWSAGLYGETEWTVIYGPEGFDPTVPGQELGTFTQTSSDIQLTGLTQLTTYDVYIYSECAADGLSSSGYFYQFTTLPYCADPTALSVASDVDSLELTWTYTANAGYNPTSFAAQYGFTGQPQGSGTEVMLMGTNSADTIYDMSLLGGGVYDVYLQATCGTDTSNWVGPFTVTMPLTNDVVCGADTLMLGQMGYVFNNTGATVTTGEDAIAPPATGAQTTTGWTNSTLNRTTWFVFQAPATGSVRLNSTAISYNNQLAVYTAADCSVFSTFTLVGANDNEINGSSVASNFTVCGLTPGDYYYLMSDGFNNTTGNYSIALSEIVLNAGSANPVTNVCSGTPVDLSTTIGGNDMGGMWMSSIAAVNASINDSILTTTGLAYTTYDLEYRVVDGCAYDSILSQVHVFGPSQAGTDGTVTVCKNQSVNLYTGLSGTVDVGGTWYNPSNQPITGSQITAANFAGSYNYDYIVSNGVCPADTSNVIVIVNGGCDALSIDEQAFAGVSVFPNPSTGLVYISSDVTEAFDLRVTDVNGRIISEVKAGVTSATTAQVDLSKVERGVYMIHLSNTTAEKTFRVVIQ